MLLAGLLVVGAAHAGGPPAPTQPPEYYVQINGPLPNEASIEVTGRVQYARPDSLDLVRRLPRVAHLLRLEAWISSDREVLQPRAADPELFRAPVPRGAPLAWEYEIQLLLDAGLPQAVGSDYWCAWLGGVILEPRVPGATDSAAVSRIVLGVRSYAGGGEYGPWPRARGLFQPASLADLTDDFLAVGKWRVHDQVAGACSLQVVLAGERGVPDDVWLERLGRELAPLAPPDGKALVCVAPTTGRLAVYHARRSWLVLWPEAQHELPAAPLFPGRHPQDGGALAPADPRSRAPEDRAPRK